MQKTGQLKSKVVRNSTESRFSFFYITCVVLVRFSNSYNCKSAPASAILQRRILITVRVDDHCKHATDASLRSSSIDAQNTCSDAV